LLLAPAFRQSPASKIKSKIKSRILLLTADYGYLKNNFRFPRLVAPFPCEDAPTFEKRMKNVNEKI